MKRLLALLFFIFLSLVLTAQAVDYGFGKVKHKRNRKVVPTIGIKVGLTHYYMDFAYDKYNRLPDDFILKPGFGLFIEYPLKKLNGLSIGCDIMMIERGFQKSFYFRGDMPEVDRINAKYIDVRIPIVYYFLTTSQINPYIIAAPDFGLCYGGEFSKTFPENPNFNQYVDISKSDAMNQFDFSLAFGAGVRYSIPFQAFTLVLKIDGSYNFGFLDTNGASESYHNDNITYQISDESRRNRGFELMLSVGIPLKFNTTHDACWGW